MERYKAVKHVNLDDLYVTTGEKLYCVGSQDGLFPNFGRHSVGEMGGIWCHPYKLADGFYMSVSENGETEWLKKGNSVEVSGIDTTFTYLKDRLEIVRRQWVPRSEKGMYIEYTFKNRMGIDRILNLKFALKTELMGAWLSDRLDMARGEDLVSFEEGCFNGKNSLNDIYIKLGTSEKNTFTTVLDQLLLPDPRVGNGKVCIFDHKITIDSESTYKVRYYLAGGQSVKEVEDTYNQIMEDYEKLFEEKLLYYQRKIHHTHLTSDDTDLDSLFNIMKINVNWLIMDVKGIGRGIVAGLPDNPRFFGCDGSYAIPALLSIGEFQLAKDTLSILKEFSIKENGNGRIVHEISTNGVVPNKGNTQETPHFIIAVLETYKWTQDKAFLEEMYDYCSKGINWLLTDMDPDSDFFPTGYGIIEIVGLNAELIDTAVYTAEALKAMAEMARILGFDSDSQMYAKKHEEAKEALLERFYMEEEGIFADVIATPEKVISAFATLRDRLDKLTGGVYHHRMASLDRLKARLDNMDVLDEELPWLIYKNWVGLTPLEVGYATEHQADSVLRRMTTEEYLGDYGLYVESLSQGIMMTISTAVLAICQGRYGYVDEMLDTMNFFKRSLNKEMPLSLSERMPKGGCIIQAWTILGTAIPIVEILFGIKPQVEKDVVIFNPKIPKSWKSAKLENIKIGDSRMSVYFKRSHGSEHYEIEILGQELTVIEDVDETVKVSYR